MILPITINVAVREDPSSNAVQSISNVGRDHTTSPDIAPVSEMIRSRRDNCGYISQCRRSWGKKVTTSITGSILYVEEKEEFK